MCSMCLCYCALCGKKSVSKKPASNYQLYFLEWIRYLHISPLHQCLSTTFHLMLNFVTIVLISSNEYPLMNIEEYRTYCLSKSGVTESIPFSKLPNVLVFKVMGKMFTATDITTFDSFSVKCKPETIEELRAQYPAKQEPSYFSKKHWSHVIMDGSIPDSILYEWLDISYDLVVAKLPKKIQMQLKS